MGSKKTVDVGRQVQALAQGLSDVLLAHEQTARDALEQAFIRGLPAAMGVTVRAYNAGLWQAIAGDRPGMLATQALKVVTGAQDALGTLLSQAGHLALTSICDELALIESLQRVRYRGVADEVRADLDPLIEPRVALALTAIAARYDEWRQVLTDMVVADWRAAAGTGEDQGVYLQRTFAPDAVRLDGHSGGGLWFKPLSWVFAEVRAQEFIVVNEVRRQAMHDWNVLVAHRG